MQQRLRFGTKFWFGFGQSAEGMKNAAFNTFLLLFYSQILGLPGWLAGLALGIALLVDAVTDPLTGSLSDAFAHRWGRRHPFMYVAAIPMWITFAFAFRPPEGLGELGLFVWMLSFAVLARLAMTLYHVPHLALGAELTEDYHERTAVVAYRNFFGLLGAVALIVVCQQVFMRPSDAFPNGQLDPSAYPPMGMFFGLLMAVAIFASALGTHSSIPQLARAADGVERFSTHRLLREMREALRNPSFGPLALGVLIFFIARGVDTTLGIYMGTYFWLLETRDVLLIPLSGALGIAVGTPAWAIFSRRLDLEKRRVFIVGVLWFSVLTFLLPVAKIVGFYPPQASPLYVPLIYGVVFLAACGAAGSLVAAGSMLADIADEHEYDVGRRQEGIFFGALSFAGKAAVGAGSALAGVGLTLIAFPLQVAPGDVPEWTVMKLGIFSGPGVAVLMFVGIALMTRYQLTRERSAEIRAHLTERRAAARGTDSRTLAPTGRTAAGG